MKISHYSEKKETIIDNDIATRVSARILIGKEEGAPNFFMRVFELEKGSHTPKHKHEWEHEIFVHSGEGEILCEGEWVAVYPGSFILIPGGDEHQFKNTKEKLFTFVCLVPSSAPEI